MTRRHAKGDGTTALKGGQWWAIVPEPPDPTTGKRRRWWLKATPNTETGAEQTRRRMLREVASRPRPIDRYRVGQWLDAWLARREHLRPNTVRYERQVVRHLAPLHGLWLDSLTPVRVQAWVDDHADRYAPKTVAGRLAVLRMALSQAVDLELLTRNPAARVHGPRVVRADHPILTPDQARALLAAVEHTPYLALFAVAALGLRQGEALGLRWADVDLDAGSLTLRRQMTRPLDGARGAKLLDAPLKTPAAYRTVPLPAPIVAALRRHRDRQRLLYGREVALVCTNQRGEALHGTTALIAWYRVRDQIGAPPTMTFHDLRHSAASLLAALGIHPSVVAAMLGHTRIQQTANYTHATESALVEAATAMGKALEG
jgi:integrase